MKKKLAFGVLIIVFLSLILKASLSSSDCAEDERDRCNRFSLTSSSPIKITHDDNFTDYGFEGTGNETDPFIIESLSIITASEYGIYVTTISKHFVIRENNIDARDIGIYIFDIADGIATVNDNICNHNEYGIQIEESSDVILSNNVCNSNVAGIHVLKSPRANLSLNTCNDNEFHGIYLFNSQDCMLVNNSCSSNTLSGLVLYASTSNDIINSTFADNLLGIYLETSWKSHFINNTIENNNQFGIQIYNSDQCTIVRNVFSKNNFYGVKLDLGSDDCVVHHNSFYNNNLDGTSQASDEGMNNAFYDDVSSEGNWWSSWSGSSYYSIDGSAGSIDPFPLGEPVVPVSEFPLRTIILGILFFCFTMLLIPIRSRQNKRRITFYE